LVQEHLRKLGDRSKTAASGLALALSADERDALTAVWRECSGRVASPGFWKITKATDVLRQVAALCRKELARRNLGPDDKLPFAAFQFVTLNLAGKAAASKQFRKEAGIRRGLLFR